jgi:hypothetical protein
LTVIVPLQCRAQSSQPEAEQGQRFELHRIDGTVPEECRGRVDLEIFVAGHRALLGPQLRSSEIVGSAPAACPSSANVAGCKFAFTQCAR